LEEKGMSIVDKVEDKVKEFVMGVAIRKGIVSASKLVVSYCASKGIIFVGTFFGIVIDTGSLASIEAALTLGVNTLLAMLRNYLKVKFPGKIGKVL
jgi:ethanolamine utilization microcompartment shell protein EutS